MDAIRKYLKVQLPKYLKGLPLPRTFSGFLKLKQEEWVYLAPLLVTIAVLLFTLLAPGSKSSKPGRVNRQIHLEKDKVVDFMDVKDIEDVCEKNKGAKCAVCRCWKSKKFPLCDGSHMKHNKETGDNVGPLVISKKE
ncbi:hypothetical protein Poli38472_000217 [Pythium oligandrum]|uniref:Iron-binding zinc finger CDGSH type domain-containing protein n=1 Tax=Pythium oligandrum TaxID=41045 RepID=A0A8K1CBP6_PYTOL|nr:hypothetical protein Poli38472_000217 [Pythium oligandrum]|eukprot:TMW60175.1 hypothetical protein Poli38472_000217 [Pythium oligandrum]